MAYTPDPDYVLTPLEKSTLETLRDQANAARQQALLAKGAEALAIERFNQALAILAAFHQMEGARLSDDFSKLTR